MPPAPARRTALLGLAALAAGVAAVPPSAAQPAADGNTVPLTFESHDGVSLQGVLHLTPLGGTQPVVVLLHAAGDDPARGGFRQLAEYLSARDRGYNVLRFDYRGHGDSTRIANTRQFFEDRINKWAFPRRARDRNPDPKLTLAEVRDARGGGYLPRLADDVMAARVALDQDVRVSTSSVYLVGAGNAASWGLLYAAAEWSRPRVKPTLFTGRMSELPPRKNSPVMRPNDPSCGLDLAGCVWLSADFGPGVGPRTARQWVDDAVDLRERTPMLFLYGAQDAAGKRDADLFVRGVFGRGAPPLTKALAVEKNKLRGAELLGKGLGTEKLIADYLDQVGKDRKNMPRFGDRGYNAPPPIELQQFGVCKF